MQISAKNIDKIHENMIKKLSKRAELLTYKYNTFKVLEADEIVAMDVEIDMIEGQIEEFNNEVTWQSDYWILVRDHDTYKNA